MLQDPPTGADVVDPDPRAVHDRAGLATALLRLKAGANLSYRRLERVTAQAPGARFGLPFTTIRDYVQGRSLPTPDRLDQIVWACRVTDPDDRAEWGRALRRAVDSGAPTEVAEPYLGPDAYDVGDVDRFHGRTALTAQLLSRLRALGGGPADGAGRNGADAAGNGTDPAGNDPAGNDPAGTGNGAAANGNGADPAEDGATSDPVGSVLAVVGPSGAGTTSLLRAGLIAGLRRAEPGRWVRYGTPGDDPSGRLAELLGAEPRPGTPVPVRPVVVLDQLEQVFTAPAPARTAFWSMLERAISGPRSAVVVLGLRADLLAAARAVPLLAGALDGRQLAVTPMSPDELREAIAEPAEAAGRPIGDGLVELLVHELRPARGEGAHAPGALPLLSVALSSTWSNSLGSELTVADYRAVGGLDGAAARAAENAWAGLPVEQQRVVRTVLLRLVRFAEDAEPVRRRAAHAELAELTGAPPVLARLVAERALTASEDTVEISHDGLLHAWPRLVGWMDADRAGHAVRGSLLEAARQWQGSDRDQDMLLRGRSLAAAVDWAAGEAGAELLPGELAYLRASLERDVTEHDAAAGHRRRLRLAVAGLAALGVLLAAVAGLLAVTRPDPLVTCPVPTPAAAPAVPGSGAAVGSLVGPSGLVDGSIGGWVGPLPRPPLPGGS